MIKHISQKRYELNGFSLIELTIVLAIVGIVFAGVSAGLGAFRHSSEIKESQKKLAHIKKQILQFGMVNKYLLCPDTDTDADGFENRNGLACSAITGNVPYLDLGLKEADVKDSWGNFIRYAVNTDSVNAAVICDKTNASSMFCNSGSASSTAWFNLTQTPPITGNRGAGNYYVCNQNTTTCSGIPADVNLETDSAVIVLVAYNQDGAQTLASCLTQGGAIQNNCDTSDNHYHQAAKTNVAASFFDDDVVFISGYEVKAQILSSLVSWNNYENAATASTPLTPTYEDFDITSSDSMSEISTTGEDVVLVNRNVSTDVNLGQSDDYIAIGNDLDSGVELKTSAGNDTVYIVGNALGTVLLGSGDDTFVLATDLTNTVKSGGGNDKVWIQGNVISGSVLQMNDGDDVLWLGDSSDSGSGQFDSIVNGGLGYDILVLENVLDWSDLTTAQRNRIRKFELVIFSDDGTGNRNYHVCNNVSNKCT